MDKSGQQGRVLEFQFERQHMIQVKAHKDEEGIVTLSFEDFSIQLTLFSLEVLIEKLQGVVNADSKASWSQWCLDADCDHDEEYSGDETEGE